MTVKSTHQSSSAYEPLALDSSVGFRLSRIVRTRRRAWSQEIESLGLTPGQASALRSIVEQPNQSLRALARTLGTDPMSMKRCIDDLETRGLVRSARALADRRPRILNVTAKGSKLAREIDRRVREDEASLREVLSEREYETLLRTLGQLETQLGIVGAFGAPAKEDNGREP